MDIGPGELLLVLGIVLLVLGPTKLPSLARSLGEALHELRRHADGDGDEATEAAPAPGPQDAP